MRSSNVMTISWEGLADLCRSLAIQVAKSFDPDVVVGIARVGTLPGALIALLLRRDFQSLRVPTPKLPATLPAHVPPTELIVGRRILLVDEVAGDGRALRWASNALSERGASEVRTLVIFPRLGNTPADYMGPEVSQTVLQPWIRATAIVDQEVQRRAAQCGLRAIPRRLAH